MIRFETLTKPGRTLSPKRAKALRDEILALNLGLSAAEAFQANWRARIDSFLDTTDVLDCVWDGDRLVGHLGERHFELMGYQAVYIDSLTVLPTLQKSGIGRKLTGRSVLRTNLKWRGRDVLHVSRTSNPHVAAGTWAGVPLAQDYYPNFDPEQTSPADLPAIAAELCEILWPEVPFHPETGVLEGAYGGHFIPVRPTRHELVANFFEQHIDAERGDAIVNIIRYHPMLWMRLAVYFASHIAKKKLAPGGARRP